MTTIALLSPKGFFLLRSIGILGALLVMPAAGEASRPIDFNRTIQPILAENCFPCHGPDEKARKDKLRLDRKEGLFQEGGDRDYAVVVPGHPEDSELIDRILSTDPEEVMPRPSSHRELTAAQKTLLERWVKEGAPWSGHWAFAAPRRPAVPALPAGVTGAQNPIDAFVFGRLAEEGLSPSPEAPREKLIRRVSLDLTGIPPTPGEIDAFLADRAAGAYEKVVDRLLASPRFGERMVWDWLDAARYADTNGYQGDSTRMMWPWRDWVIKAFNDNLPFDQFTIDQLAGDLLPGATREQRLATAFNRNHMLNNEGGSIPEESRVGYVLDRVDTTSTVWLGLTLGCARCHDHKFDPFTQREYYQLSAYFNQVPESGKADAPPIAKPVLSLATPEEEARVAALKNREKAALAERNAVEARVKAAQPEWEREALAHGLPGPEPTSLEVTPEDANSENPPATTEAPSAGVAAALAVAPDRRTAAQAKELADFHRATSPEWIAAVRKYNAAKLAAAAAGRALPRVMVMEDGPKPRDTFILVRGAYDQPAAKVAMGTPQALPPLPAGAPANRLALARWLVSPENPLTARVTVNRYWAMIFGVGLVKTTSDFGSQGEKPSHPELLDWLAREFIESGWDTKHLLRLIVTSGTYRQSSQASAALTERDPENRLLARGPRFRLPSWMIRDQALAASGLLAEKVGGPPVNGYQPPGIWEEATFGKITYDQDHGDALYRRSVYLFWRRIVGPTVLFDTASRQTCTVAASRTNTPLHALTTLNDVTYVEAARVLAERALRQGGATDAARIAFAFRLLTARRPGAGEAATLAAALARFRRQFAAAPAQAKLFVAAGESKPDSALDPVELAAHTALGSLLLNLDETLTKE